MTTQTLLRSFKQLYPEIPKNYLLSIGDYNMVNRGLGMQIQVDESKFGIRKHKRPLSKRFLNIWMR